MPNKPGNAYYDPSTGAAAVFAVLFGLTTAIHIFQWVRYKKAFSWVIVMACAWETAGFVFRILWTKDSSKNTWILPEQLLLILAPLWVNAFDYMVLGRMIHFFLPERKILKVAARRVTLYFVLFDVAAFIVQALGGVIVSSKNGSTSSKNTGKGILVGGLVLQEAFFIFFIVIAAQFHRRVVVANESKQRQWAPLLYALYASLVCITARTIYRIVEFSQPLDGTIDHSEAYFYCLEATPILISVALFNIWHPGKVLVGPGSDFNSDLGRPIHLEEVA